MQLFMILINCPASNVVDGYSYVQPQTNKSMFTVITGCDSASQFKLMNSISVNFFTKFLFFETKIFVALWKQGG